MGQLALFDIDRYDSFKRPDDGMLCDSCNRLVWHRNGDGYCCCMAPGMRHINAKRRKPAGSECRFYRPLEVEL